MIPKIPGYQLKSQLGAGGMGVVYFATRDDNDYQYAIKMLLVGRNASIEELARFRIEAEAYACLNHPYIVKIRDVGVVKGCPFLAMDYAENGCLSDYIEKSPSLDLNWRLETIKKVADALFHAHSRRILHRDLKPANILIAADGSPRISDFGLVKFSAPLSDVNQSCCTFQVTELDQHLLQMVSENKRLLPVEDNDDLIKTLAVKCADRSGLTTATFNLDAVHSFVNRSIETRRFSGELSTLLDDMTRHGTVMGSPQFMSPEQAEGRLESIGPHTDVYGLGATLYHVATGKTPVTGSNVWDIVRNVSTQQPVPPNAINSSVSEDLSFVIMKSLDKNPSRRYPNMELFSEDLGRILEGRAPLARLHARSTAVQKGGVSLFQQLASSLSTLMPSRQKATN
ncbi:MAG: serine/threonine protein kinase, partial [Pirellulaceae bacterium]